MSILLRKSLLDYGQHETTFSRYCNGLCAIFTLEKSGYSQIFSFRIEPVENLRIVPPGLFQKLYHFRDLLLAQDRQLQDEHLAVLGKLILTSLGAQDQDDHVERHK